jgi:hypothetical protein
MIFYCLRNLCGISYFDNECLGSDGVIHRKDKETMWKAYTTVTTNSVLASEATKPCSFWDVSVRLMNK